jgi:DNA-binding response OmpR family regulator
MLTAKDSVGDKVSALNAGADDYVTKPFSIDELMARIKTRLRNTSGQKSSIKVGELELNTQTVQVTRSGKEIVLTPQEFRLLEYLMKNKGIVLSREMILNRIWMMSSDVDTRVVDVYMGYLRKKIDAGFNKPLLHSIRGFGYTIKD